MDGLSFTNRSALTRRQAKHPVAIGDEGSLSETEGRQYGSVVRFLLPPKSVCPILAGCRPGKLRQIDAAIVPMEGVDADDALGPVE
ncbi:MAG: hypothetical protein ACXU89_02990, partial [Xanthobacteraceae bacterium]